jgi:hypothetical protein
MLITAFASAGCQKHVQIKDVVVANHDLSIKFRAVVDNQPLIFGNAYTNVWGEEYTVSVFRFYVSNIKLINTSSGKAYDVNKDEYFLVNFADSNSTLLKLKAVPFTYDRINFLLGVDSIRNVSGAQTGALDPLKGMFWTWNSGYIMAKLEGNSPFSTQVNNAFEYHVGGFSGPDNVLKQVPLQFPGAQNVTFQADKSSHLIITANVNDWFHGANDLKISVNPVSMVPGPLSRRISENYFKMFTITNVVTE